MELIEQLPKRMDDFTKFKLPTPAEWSELKTTLTRDQQIDYLCERMRLLNRFQQGQPGGSDPNEQQYAEPCGLSDDAAWGLRRGTTKVLNPLTELAGERHGEKWKSRGLELTTADIPLISKYLRDDHYMLCVSFWRDFAPDRDLTKTRTLFASIINGIANEDVCRVRDWDALTPAEIDNEIERINAWAAENPPQPKTRAFARPWVIASATVVLFVCAIACWFVLRRRRVKRSPV